MNVYQNMERERQIQDLLDDGWIPMKQFRMEEAHRLGISEIGVHQRFVRGKYFNLKRIWFNKRMIFVKAI